MKKILANNSGQAMMEYIIISFLVVLICIGSVKGLGKDLKGKLDGMRKSINSNLDLRTIK